MIPWSLPADWPRLPAAFAVRPMTPGDLDAVLAIEAHANPAPLSRSGFVYELTANSLAAYLVLTHVAQPIGYAGHWLMVDEAHISFIAVDSGRRRHGGGALLLAATLAQALARGAALATLEVRRSNAPAQRLYARFGFVEVGVRRRYYKDSGEDALIMTLDPLLAAPLAAAWRAAVAQLTMSAP